MNQGSTAAVPFMGPNPNLFSKYQQHGSSTNTTSTTFPNQIDDVEEKPGYAFYCDKCDHIDMRRSDFMRHKIVHITPIVDDFIPPTTRQSDLEGRVEEQVVPNDPENTSKPTKIEHNGKADNGDLKTKVRGDESNKFNSMYKVNKVSYFPESNP